MVRRCFDLSHENLGFRAIDLIGARLSRWCQKMDDSERQGTIVIPDSEQEYACPSVWTVRVMQNAVWVRSHAIHPSEEPYA